MSLRRKWSCNSKQWLAPFITTAVLATAINAWAQPTKIWTDLADWQSAQDQQNVDLTSLPGSVKIGPVLPTLLATPSITCVTPTKIYTTSVTGETIAAVDPTTDAVTTINLPGPAAGVVYNPMTNKVYVGQANGNTVTVIDVATNTTSTLTIGTAASGVYAAAYNPNTAKMYITNTGDQNVTILNANNDEVLAVKPVTTGATTATFDAAANKLYLTNSGNNYVTVIDGDTNDVKHVPVAAIEGLLGKLQFDAASVGINSGDHILLTANASVLPEKIQYRINGSQWTSAGSTFPFTTTASVDAKLTYDGPTSPVLDDLTLTYFFKITASAGTGGTISPAGDSIVAYNEDRCYSITPNTGYHLADIKVDNISVPNPQTSYCLQGVNNNHAISATFAADGPDLIISQASLPGGTSLRTGTMVSIPWTAKNQGQVNASAFHVTVNFCPTTTITADCRNPFTSGEVTISGLLPNQETSGQSYTVRVPTMPPGTNYLLVSADKSFQQMYVNRVAETDENNNDFVIPIDLAYGPDLVITGVYPPQTAVAGSLITIPVDVTNQGVSGASASFTALYMCDTPEVSKACREIGRATNPTSLSAGTTLHATLYGRLPAGTTGVKYIGAIADVTNTVGEFDEDNNDDYTGVPITIN